MIFLSLSISIPVAALTTCGGVFLYYLCSKGRCRCRFKDFCNCCSKGKCRFRLSDFCNCKCCVNCKCKKRNDRLRIRESSRIKDDATGRDTVTFRMPPDIFNSSDSLSLDSSFSTQPSTSLPSTSVHSANTSGIPVSPPSVPQSPQSHTSRSPPSTSQSPVQNSSINPSPVDSDHLNSSSLTNVTRNDSTLNETDKTNSKSTERTTQILNTFMNTVKNQFYQKTNKSRVKQMPVSSLTNMFNTTDVASDNHEQEENLSNRSITGSQNLSNTPIPSVSSKEIDKQLPNLSNTSSIPMIPMYSSSPYSNQDSTSPSLFPRTLSSVNLSREMNQSIFTPSPPRFNSPVSSSRFNSSMFFTPPMRFQPPHISQSLRNEDETRSPQLIDDATSLESPHMAHELETSHMADETMTNPTDRDSMTQNAPPNSSSDTIDQQLEDNQNQQEHNISPSYDSKLITHDSNVVPTNDINVSHQIVSDVAFDVSNTVSHVSRSIDLSESASKETENSFTVRHEIVTSDIVNFSIDSGDETASEENIDIDPITGASLNDDCDRQRPITPTFPNESSLTSRNISETPISPPNTKHETPISPANTNRRPINPTSPNETPITRADRAITRSLTKSIKPKSYKGMCK